MEVFQKLERVFTDLYVIGRLSRQLFFRQQAELFLDNVELAKRK